VSAANALKVDGSAVTQPVSGTVSLSGSVDTELPAAAALADNTANPTVPGVGAFLMAFDGTNWDRVQTGAAASGALKVDGSAVTQPVSGTVTANQGGAPWSENITQLGGNAINTGTGAAGTGTARVALATDGQGQLVDNAAFTDGTTRVDVAGYIYDEVAGTALTENDVAAARVNVNRAQVLTIEDGATRARYATVTASNALKVDGSGVTQPVSGTVSVSGTVTVDSELPAAAALATDTANPTVPGVGAFGMVYDGSTWDRTPGNSTEGTLVYTKRSLTASTPTTATVNGTSGSAVASNASRKGLILRNTSTSGQRISLHMAGGTAVLDSGVTLYVGDAFQMDEYDFTTAAISAIASAASGRLSVQEMT
jgi:hypothetical protein